MRKKQLLLIAIQVIRAVFFWFATLLTATLAGGYFAAQFESFDAERMPRLIAGGQLAALLLVYLLFCRVWCAGSNTARSTHLAKYPEERTFPHELCRTIRAVDYLAEVGTVAFFLLVLPTFVGLSSVAGALFPTVGRIAAKWLTVAFLLPVLALFSLLTHTAARADWYREQKRNKRLFLIKETYAPAGRPLTMPAGQPLSLLLFDGHGAGEGRKDFFFKKHRSELANSLLRTAKALGLLLLYGFCICMLFRLLPLVLSFWLVLAILAAALVAFALLRIPYAYIRALFKRRALLRSLHETCRRIGATASPAKAPYRSVFHSGGSEAFVVKTEKKTYTVRLFAGVFRNSPMVFSELEGGEYRHAFRFARITWAGLVTSFDYAFEGEGEKVLLLSPVPREIYVGKQLADLRPADNGEVLGEYKIFTATGFLNHLEREA